MATVDLKDIKKSFGKVDVIHGVDMEIADGEFIVIVGPSGCGKSTLLRMVAGLETITSGELLIGGKRANDTEPMDRDIAMVFQNYALYPHMTVADNMAYGLKIAGMPKDQIKAKVQEAAKLLQLDHLLDRKPRELSGGQRQRVAMGRAIVREPSVFLFDEPLSNLDAKLRVQMRLEIKDLQAKLGITSLYVTHDQVEAMTMADRMIVMNGGVAEQIGTPLDVYERPQTIFAAQFIGSPSMNLMDGRIDGGQLKVNDVSLGPVDTREGDVTVGLRPEHVFADSAGVLRLNVHQSEPLGANTLLHGTLEGKAFTASLPGVHRMPGNDRDMSLNFASENLHLFDPKTGKRI
ncbi:sn-glycerol-3-phosphate import ATP-binding protein UgpC [Palleronia caenipelagi]|uniref:sn-glycerol-3-phosphate import ATP-binding protein UgpC n=1 Tax=Palleronia caenipelagi TaxID=2489174 RepID=A0A547PXQ2_9RHOB|nr:sn-glycerol-3-phosphate import ATP-binding protein UgpC [Palleronia caenipelagi]TRD18937.1 sn-glycerol-3-phosphate import ATP-binding protein UgpC [Palleronia caenipelagi]